MIDGIAFPEQCYLFGGWELKFIYYYFWCYYNIIDIQHCINLSCKEQDIF